MRVIFRLKNLLAFVVGLWIMHSLSSCVSTRNLVYMQGAFDTARLSQVNAIEPVIRKGDILSIIVYSDNPEATRIYNQSLVATGNPNVMGTSGIIQAQGGSAPSAPGYEVDQKGDIVFQGLGHLHVEGLTKAALKDTLDDRLTPFLQHPYYNIRFLNYKFTMLGELGKPGIITIPGERINLLEAISLAGDLTFYGRRDNVQVIRESNNKREFARLDLTKPEIMKSPYFYLQQNDIVIVEPTRKKVAATDQTFARNLAIVTSITSLIVIVYSVFRNN